MTDDQLTIAIVEDDVILREELGHFLQSHGYVVHELVSGTALDDLVHETSVDILILDLNLPGQTGFEIAQRYRQNDAELGIIILSARTTHLDRIASYRQGADIYVPKPCPPDELLAAVGSLARRVKPTQGTENWLLDPVRQVLSDARGVIAIQLLTVESAIIQLLARASKHQMSADDLCVFIAETVSNREMGGILSRRALENRISRLRKKFASQAKEETTLIRSVRGEGYQLCLPVSVLPHVNPVLGARTDNPNQ